MTVAMDKYPLLAEIASPADLRRLPVGKLPEVAAELRDFLIHSVSTRGGHFAAGVASGPELASLERFGAEVGLAFQIQDDILDVEGDPALLGKSTGADAAHAKPTYPSTAGLAAAKRRADELRDAAVAALAPLGERAAALAQLADFVVNRAS